MALLLDAASLPPVPSLDGGWVLRPAGDCVGGSARGARAYTAVRDGGPHVLLEIHRVPRHPLCLCYPFGAHDLAVEIALPAGTGPEEAAGLLRALVPALFAAEPRCRRIVAAPAEDDTAAQDALAAAGFRRITEADLPGGATVVLHAAEPPELADLSTALDDMPH